MSAGEYCNRDVVVAKKTLTAREAAKLMREQHVGTLVVIEPGDKGVQPVGMLTDRDLVVELVAAEVDSETITVGDIMSTDITTTPEDTKLMDAIELMKNKGIRRLPVVDATGSLAGILTVDDVIDLIAEQLSDLSKLILLEQRHEQELRD
jgi:CBS domain-containing protein